MSRTPHPFGPELNPFQQAERQRAEAKARAEARAQFERQMKALNTAARAVSAAVDEMVRRRVSAMQAIAAGFQRPPQQDAYTLAGPSPGGRPPGDDGR